jgi:hypothetical protein
MSVTVTQITTEQYFGTWLARTNQLVDIISANAVTTSLTAAGGFTSGNAYVSGVVAAKTMAANSMHGGNNTSWSNLTITSNVYVSNSTGPSTIYTGNSSANVFIGLVPATNTIFSTNGNVNSYLQAILQNANGGVTATTDLILNADTATDTTNYLDIGINSSGYSNTLYTINGALDAYMYSSNGGLAIGTAGIAPLQFFVGGTLSTNEVVRITAGANVGIGTKTPNAKLQVVGSANISGVTYISNSIFISGNTSITGNTYATGFASFANSVTIAGNNTITKNANVGGTVFVGSNVFLSTSTLSIANTLGNTQYTAGTIALANSTVNIFSVNTTSVNSSVEVGIAGALTVSNSVYIGNTKIDGTINTTANVTLANSIVRADLRVNGNTYLGTNSTHWTEIVNLKVTGQTVSVQSSTGDFNPASDAESITPQSLGSSALRWNLKAFTGSFDNTLTVGKAATFSKNMDVGGNVAITSGNITIGTGSVTITNGTNTNFYSGLLYLDTTTSRIGIGNTTPGSPLTVKGIVKSTYVSGTTGGGFEFPDGTLMTAAPNAFGAAGQVQFYDATNGTNRFYSTSGLVFTASSNNLTVGTGGTVSAPTISSTTINNSGTVALNSVGYTFAGSASTTVPTPISSTPFSIDQYSLTVYRAAEYLVQVTAPGGKYQSSKILVIHDGTNAYVTEYGTLIPTGQSTLVTFSAGISGTNVILYALYTQTGVNTLKFVRTLMAV